MRKKTCLFTILLILTTGIHLAMAGTVAFQWSPNTEPDLNGYKLYYGSAPRTQAPYTGSVAITDKAATTYSIELPAGTYYFALTAYDTDNNESDFSTEVQADVTETALGKPGKPLLITQQ